MGHLRGKNHEDENPHIDFRSENMKKWETCGFHYEGAERRSGGQRRRPMYDPKAEERMHGKEMIESKSIMVDRKIKFQYGYDAGVLYWHVSMRHKFAGVQYFFPQAPYHEMLGISAEDLEVASQVLEDAGLLKRAHYDGKTGYKIIQREK